MDPSQCDLWARLCEFTLDDPSATLTFTQRLARENGWTVGFADRAVEEYKRFLLLAMTAGHSVTPSDQVDQVWHLHLTYTRSYWNELCGELLGGPLHHGPTKGGKPEGRRFDDQYRETLASYRRAFQVEPPPDLWPAPEERFDDPARYVRVDKHDAWVLPKPWMRLRAPRVGKGVGYAFGAAPLLVVAISNPLRMEGPEFLGFYAGLLLTAGLIACLLRALLRPGWDSTPGELSPYEVACLATGVEGAVRTATVWLAHRRLIEAVPGDKPGEVSFNRREPTPLSAVEIEQRLMAAADNGRCDFGDLLSHAKPAAEKIEQRLMTWGLIVPRDGLHASRWVPVALMGTILALGATRLVARIERGEPVGFLVVELVIGSLLAAPFVTKPHRTRTGNETLARFRRQYAQPKGKHLRETNPTTRDIVMAAALFGLDAVAFDEMALLPTAWKSSAAGKRGATGRRWGSGSGCGAVIGGGSGGDSGCGGGGCGGCGGCGG